ncbi:MAG: hypothetical protein CM1200mP36_08400 [Gammaproteobacteria bacterium]|nr:MAG: hypothetical protein CM1200mP36_08400 [Gammaproteobacteria bacterium]
MEGWLALGHAPLLVVWFRYGKVFIFDFDEDIYGKYITVPFVERLREERKYSDLATMTTQMQKM